MDRQPLCKRVRDGAQSNGRFYRVMFFAETVRRRPAPAWRGSPATCSCSPKFALEFVSKYASMVRSLIWLQAASHRINKDPQRLRYMDQALTPVSEGETQSLELFTHTDDARHAVEHARKVAHLTAGERLTAGEQLGDAALGDGKEGVAPMRRATQKEPPGRRRGHPCRSAAEKAS
jgi:hypothetical protein